MDLTLKQDIFIYKCLVNFYLKLGYGCFKETDKHVLPFLSSLKAFIWDSARLEYEAARHCNLATVGDLFGRSGYGIGFTRDSPWADRITLDILHFHESE